MFSLGEEVRHFLHEKLLEKHNSHDCFLRNSVEVQQDREKGLQFVRKGGGKDPQKSRPEVSRVLETSFCVLNFNHFCQKGLRLLQSGNVMQHLLGHLGLVQKGLL